MQLFDRPGGHLCRRPNTSEAKPGHKVYPYLLRGPGGSTDGEQDQPGVGHRGGTYIPMARGFLVGLVAIRDWHSLLRAGQGRWRLSNTLEPLADFWAAVDSALTIWKRP